MKKISALIFFTSSLLFLSFSFLIFKVKADDSPVPSLKFPCNQTANPEFSSDRPYQASPCGSANKALFCSNSLSFVESFNFGNVCDSQAPPGGGNFICDLTKIYSGSSECGGSSGFCVPKHTVTVNLADASLPILGNTELTPNSSSPGGEMDDATKSNEYVSWYLNGTVNKAETGSSTFSNPSDLAGPIQKIMPQVILEAQRIETLKSPHTNVTYSVDEDTIPNPAQHPGPTATVTEPSNHNQIVVCAKKAIGVVLPSWVSSLTGIGSVGFGPEIPIDCYKDAKSSTQGDVYRLDNTDLKSGDRSWEGSTDVVQDAKNWVLSNIPKIIPESAQGVVNPILGDLQRWTLKIPPLPWDDGTGKSFSSYIAYQKAYNEWRGQYCLYNPLTGNQTLICTGSVFGLLNNPYADLFPYVPLANTVDKHGAEADYIAEIQPEGQTELGFKTYDPPVGAPLWTAHTLEDAQLSQFLNQSFAPKNSTNSAVTENTENNSGACRIVDVRSNPGDNLFAGQPHGIYVPGVSYTITQVECKRTVRTVCNTSTNTRKCPGGPGDCCDIPTTTCSGDVSITLPTQMKTPYADDIWQNTVAGADSTFRRIYPKVEQGAPVSCIADTPASTGVTYTPIDPVGGGADNFKVIDPSGAKTTDNPQLYFPHLGGVYDYFLKGIQTALRPLGYGDPTPQSGSYCTPPLPNECKENISDSALPPTYSGSFKANFLDLANRFSSVCPGPDLNLAAKCYNYVVTQSVKAKVNPAFTLAVWLHETGASNYCASGSTAQDLGIRDPSIYQNLPQQLKRFLGLPFSSLYTSCKAQSGFPDGMSAFFSEFRSGTCDPNDSQGKDYYPELMNSSWQWLVPGCITNGKFSINWPTDMSCPGYQNIK